MQIRKEVGFGSSIGVELVGDIELDLRASDAGWQGVEIETAVPEGELVVEVTPEIIRVIDVEKKRLQGEKVDEFVGGLDTSRGVAGLILSGVASIQKAMSVKDAARRVVVVTIRLPETVGDLKIKADNVRVKTGLIRCGKFRLKCGNLRLTTACVIDSDDVKITGSNVKMSCHFGRRGGRLRVDANNAKIKVFRTQGQIGSIVCTGNNFKVEGNLPGESEFGVLEINCNNGKLSVTEEESEAFLD